MTLAEQIRDCTSIPPDDKRRALRELHRMQTDARYAEKVCYVPAGLPRAFVWPYTDSGRRFWVRIHQHLTQFEQRNALTR